MLQTLEPIDAMFLVAAVIGLTLAMASAVTLLFSPRPGLAPEKERAIKVAVVLELLFLIGGAGLAWSGVHSITTRFGAEGMTAMFLVPAARACVGLTLAVVIANGVALFTLPRSNTT